MDLEVLGDDGLFGFPFVARPLRSLGGAVRALHRVGLKPCMMHGALSG